MSDSVEQLNLFEGMNVKHEQDEASKVEASALPDSASSQWQQLYHAVSNYAKKLDHPSDYS